MWQSKTKTDLIIEVWEKLDCENIGRAELEAIEIAVGVEYGLSQFETPMRIARILADEGAELRHSEILKLDAERRTNSPYAPIFRNLIKVENLREAQTTLKQIENLRRKFERVEDRTGLHELREVIKIQVTRLREIGDNQRSLSDTRKVANEVAEWFSLWLGNPEIIDGWLEIRLKSIDFKKRFGDEQIDLPL